MDFVATYQQWVQQSGDYQISDFLGWLANHCDATAGEVMTDSELEIISGLAGATPSEVEEALMESAWP